MDLDHRLFEIPNAAHSTIHFFKLLPIQFHRELHVIEIFGARLMQTSEAQVRPDGLLNGRLQRYCGTRADLQTFREDRDLLRAFTQSGNPVDSGPRKAPTPSISRRKPT